MSTEVPDRWKRPIFIASMGRSGSTLLQRVLNTHPEVTIWGEHGGFLSGMLSSYRVASQPDAAKNLIEGYEHREMVIGELSDTEIFKPWVSPFRPDDLERAVASTITELFTEGLTPNMRWGFKEIRYNDEDLVTLMEMFPDGHLIILVRDLHGYAKSRFFAFGNTEFDIETDEGKAKARKRLTAMTGGWIKRYQGLESVRTQFADRTSVVAYGDLVQGSNRPSELFAELGDSSPRQAALDAVLGAVSGSSYKHNSRARSNRDNLSKLIDDADIDWDAYQGVMAALGLS